MYMEYKKFKLKMSGYSYNEVKGWLNGLVDVDFKERLYLERTLALELNSRMEYIENKSTKSIKLEPSQVIALYTLLIFTDPSILCYSVLIQALDQYLFNFPQLSKLSAQWQNKS